MQSQHLEVGEDKSGLHGEFGDSLGNWRAYLKSKWNDRISKMEEEEKIQRQKNFIL